MTKNVIEPDIIGFRSFIENKFSFIKTIFSTNLKMLKINNARVVARAAPTIPY